MTVHGFAEVVDPLRDAQQTGLRLAVCGR